MEKTFANFEVLWLFAKDFSMKILFSTSLRKFSPTKFSHYTVYSSVKSPERIA